MFRKCRLRDKLVTRPVSNTTLYCTLFEFKFLSFTTMRLAEFSLSSNTLHFYIKEIKLFVLPQPLLVWSNYILNSQSKMWKHNGSTHPRLCLLIPEAIVLVRAALNHLHAATPVFLKLPSVGLRGCVQSQFCAWPEAVEPGWAEPCCLCWLPCDPRIQTDSCKLTRPLGCMANWAHSLMAVSHYSQG